MLETSSDTLSIASPSSSRRFTKIKRLQSAYHDRTQGVWICKHCGYRYTNPNPDSRQRRVHKKVCPGQGDSDDNREVLNQSMEGKVIQTLSSEFEIKDTPMEDVQIISETKTGEGSRRERPSSLEAQQDSQRSVRGGELQESMGKQVESVSGERPSSLEAQQESQRSGRGGELKESMGKQAESVSGERPNILEAQQESQRAGKRGELYEPRGRQAKSLSGSADNEDIDTKELHSRASHEDTYNLKPSGHEKVDATALGTDHIDCGTDVSQGELPYMGEHPNEASSSMGGSKNSDANLGSKKAEATELGTDQYESGQQGIKEATGPDFMFFEGERLSFDRTSDAQLPALRSIDDKEVGETASEAYVANAASLSRLDHDLERVLREQATYDLICPACGSLITHKIILRKRRRTFISKEDPRFARSTEITPQVVDQDEKLKSMITPDVQKDDGWGEGCLSYLCPLFMRRGH